MEIIGFVYLVIGFVHANNKPGGLTQEAQQFVPPRRRNTSPLAVTTHVIANIAAPIPRLTLPLSM